jgi:short-subunit dehydrogenase
MNVHSYFEEETDWKGSLNMSKSLNILVTGATAGIGRHAALELAKRGHHVFATGRRREALESLKKEAGTSKLDTLVLDVTDQDSIETTRREIDRITKGHGLDVIVNNAGYGLVGPLEEISDADLRDQFETNVFGLMSITRTFVGKMRERGFGRVVNVSSIGGRVTFPMMGAYHATKYAVEALSNALRMELGAFGVGVSLIEPGVIKTEFGDVALKAVGRYENGTYGAIVRHAEEMNARFQATGVGPEHTTRAIVKAIESRRPRARYVAPRRAALAFALFALIPTLWMDAILRGVMRLNKKYLLGQREPAPQT